MKDIERVSDVMLAWSPQMHEIGARTVTRNAKFLELHLDLNHRFINATGIDVLPEGDVALDIREANIRECVKWFETNLRARVKAEEIPES